MKIELEPNLNHCIQTLAKKEYEKSLRELLKIDENAEAADKIEILRMFLEDADFKKLRKEYEPYLVSGEKVRFLIWSEKGKIKYDFKLGG
jgi:hypothetical protein